MNRILVLILGLSFAVSQAILSYGAEELPTATAPVAEPANAIEYSVQDELVTIRATDVTVQSVLDQLLKDFPIELEIPDAIRSAKVTLDLKDVAVDKVIEALAGSQALVFERVGEGYRLVSAQLTTRQDYIAPTLPKMERKDQRNVSDKVKQAKKLLAQFDSIYNEAGELDYDQAKKLIQERDAKVQAIVDELIAMGPGGARAMNDIYATEPGTRQQEAMIKALAKIQDEEAPAVLGALYAVEDKYSLQRDIVGSLGWRKEAASEDILKSLLSSQNDNRIRAGVVQALSGRPGSVGTLASVITSSSEDSDVRHEAIRSVGLAGTEEAKTVLTDAAAAGKNDLILRKTAIQELARSYGEAAVPQLEVFLKDTDEGVRQSAIRALGRIGSNDAIALLRTASTSDVSAIIRAHAEAALANHGAATTPN